MNRVFEPEPVSQGGIKVVAIIPVYEEAGKIGNVLLRFPDGVVNEICLLLDAPSQPMMREVEASCQSLRTPVVIFRNATRKGLANALKQGFRHALEGSYDVVVVLAGNGKDDPREIPKLLQPILHEGYDYVQGSRFLPGGFHKTPFLRFAGIKLYTLFWYVVTGRDSCNDVTNGFKAFKTSILRDTQVNVWQDWLTGYAVEFYLHFKVLTIRGSKTRKYCVKEVPVSKIYLEMRRGYSKISPVRDFWNLARAPVMLKSRMKK